jgi:hypothetical protein
MKTTKQTWFVLLTVAGSLLLAPLVPAQEKDAAVDAQVSAPTNNLAGAPAASATNDAVANS